MRNIKKVTLIIIALSFIAALNGCGQKGIVKKTGLIPDYAKLSEDPTGFADRYFVQNDVAWGAYDKVMIDNVNFFISDKADYKGINADEFKELEKYFNSALIKSLKGNYKAVQNPEPGTLRLVPAITHVAPGSPVAGTVTTVVPVGLAASLVKKGVTGSHIGMAGAELEAVLMDAMTNRVLAAVIIIGTGEKYKITKSVSEWGQVEAMFDAWTGNLTTRLNMLSGR